MKRIWLLLTLVLSITIVLPAQAQEDLLGRINNLRASKGLPAYTPNGALTAAAQNQALWLVNNGCAIAHTHPDGSNPRSRAQAAGYPTADVSENIYCGGVASSSDAWVFWVNSGIHYAGLVNTRYKEIGVATASGAAGISYVLVFGNPGGPDFVPPAAASSGGGGGGSSAPPSYVVGSDEHGNIMHQIQSGDTLGQIALIYGYTWNDIPGMLAINGMTEADYRSLKEGEIFLVPPKSGTYTPTPGGEAIALEVTATPAASTPLPEATATPFPSPTATLPPTIPPVATANSVPEAVLLALPTATVTPQVVAMAGSPVPLVQTTASVTPSGTPAWLIVGLVVQVVVLIGAGIEYLRRSGRKR